MRKLRHFTVACMLAVLSVLGYCAVRPARPARADRHEQGPSDAAGNHARRMTDVATRLSAPSQVRERTLLDAAVRVREAAAREAALAAESGALLRGMHAFLASKYGSAVADRVSARQDLAGFAGLLVQYVHGRSEAGRWLPIGRVEAPALLAAIAFHEGSWRWRSDLRGSRGERCVMQVNPGTVHIVGLSPRVAAADPGTCLEAAVRVLEKCSELCGPGPFERTLGCYATAGACGGARDVVAVRMTTHRALLDGSGREQRRE